MVRVHGLFALVSGFLLGVSVFMYSSYEEAAPFWYYLPSFFIYLACLFIVPIKQGYTMDAFDTHGPEAFLQFFHKSPKIIKRLLVGSAALCFVSVNGSVAVVINRNGDPNVAVFMLQIMLAVLGYVCLALASVFDMAETQDSTYGG